MYYIFFLLSFFFSYIKNLISVNVYFWLFDPLCADIITRITICRLRFPSFTKKAISPFSKGKLEAFDLQEVSIQTLWWVLRKYHVSFFFSSKSNMCCLIFHKVVLEELKIKTTEKKIIYVFYIFSILFPFDGLVDFFLLTLYSG